MAHFVYCWILSIWNSIFLHTVAAHMLWEQEVKKEIDIALEKEGWINARFFTVHVSGTMMDTYGIIDSLTRTMDRRCFYG